MSQRSSARHRSPCRTSCNTSNATSQPATPQDRQLEVLSREEFAPHHQVSGNPRSLAAVELARHERLDRTQLLDRDDEGELERVGCVAAHDAEMLVRAPDAGQVRVDPRCPLRSALWTTRERKTATCVVSDKTLENGHVLRKYQRRGRGCKRRQRKHPRCCTNDDSASRPGSGGGVFQRASGPDPRRKQTRT
eukprot:2152408-Rhodomonas_salina.2